MTGLTAKQMVYEARILFESIASNDAPGFTDREWSVLLTNAQNKVVYEVYKTGFDNNEEGRTVVQNLLTPFEVGVDKLGLFPNSFVFTLPNDYMYVTMDRCVTKEKKTAKLVAIPQDAYYSNIENPFKRPTKDKFWKIISGDTRTIITDGQEVTLYLGEYLKRPEAIIVSTLPLGKGIEIRNNEEVRLQADCKLHSNVHRRIVEVAARLAYAATLDPNGYQIQNVEAQRI